MGPKFCVHAYLPLMGSRQTHTGHVGINTLGTGASTRFQISRSWLQGKRSQNLNSIPMHIYPTWIVHRPKLTTLASKLWTQEGPQESHGQGHGSKAKGHRTKIQSHAHLPIMGSPHAQTGHNGINTLVTEASTAFPSSRSWSQGQRLQDQNSMPMHICSSWVVNTPSLGKLAWIPWPQQRPQKFVDGQTFSFYIWWYL